MFKITTLLAAAAIVAATAAPSDAKNPKGCKRTNVRPANPQGSVLVQSSPSAAVGGTAMPTSGDGIAPVMVFGGAQPTGGEATGTVVPGIASETEPAPGSAQPRRKARKSRRSAAINASSLLGTGAIAASSSC